MRKAFGLVQALVVIVMVSGILVVAMKYAQVSVKQTSDVYAKESAELFMDSAVELTLLAISDHNRTSNGCLKEVHLLSADQRYRADVNITMYYVYEGQENDGTVFNCDANRITSIQTEESHGMVMLEIVLKTNEAHPKNADKHIRLTRRTLQRP